MGHPAPALQQPAAGAHNPLQPLVSGDIITTYRGSPAMISRPDRNMARHASLDAVIERLHGLEPGADIVPVVRAAMAGFGLDHCVYLARSVPGARDDEPLFLTTYPEAWVAHYIDKGYVFVDPVLKQADRSIVPIDWAEIDRSSAPVRRLFGESREFGIGGQGLTFSMRGPFGDRALFSVNGDQSDRDWRLLRPDLMRDMQLFALHLHQHMMAAALPDRKTVRLTRRETETLSLAAKGLSAKEIARKLHISPAAVRAYLDSARYRLGAANRAQTVALGVRLGLV